MIIDEIAQKHEFKSLKESFFKAIEGLEIKADIPLGFAKIYVSRKKTKNDRDAIPIYVLRKDFEYLFNKVSKITSSIVICIDEGDVLTLNKELMQILRNLFQEIKGYNLIIVGTEKLVEKISDVFSPVPRLFYRINIGPFRTSIEAIDSIETPIKKLKPLKYGVGTVRDIIRFTNYNPYEINLICYHAFEEAVMNNDTEINLSKKIFDKIKNQKRELTEYEKQFYLLSGNEQDFLKNLVISGGISNLYDFSIYNTKPSKLDAWEKTFKTYYKKYEKIFEGLSDKNLCVNGENPILKISIGDEDIRYFEIYDSWLVFFIKYVLLANVDRLKFYRNSSFFQFLFENMINKEYGKELIHFISGMYAPTGLNDEELKSEHTIKKENGNKYLIIFRKGLYYYNGKYKIIDSSDDTIHKIESFVKEWEKLTRISYLLI